MGSDAHGGECLCRARHFPLYLRGLYIWPQPLADLSRGWACNHGTSRCLCGRKWLWHLSQLCDFCGRHKAGPNVVASNDTWNCDSIGVQFSGVWADIQEGLGSQPNGTRVYNSPRISVAPWSIRYRQGHFSVQIRFLASSVFARMRSFRMMATVAFILGM
jgi:hypothetical protein